MPALFELSHGHPDALQDVQRLEARDHDRDPVLVGQGLVLVPAHHRADVAGRQEALHPVRGILEDGDHGRRHGHVGHEDAEVLDPELPRPPHRHGIGRRRRLESNGEEDDLLVGICSRQLDRVERGVDDADLAAPGAHLKQVALASRYPKHVAEGGEDHVGP